jgi:hypothetical protein
MTLTANLWKLLYGRSTGTTRIERLLSTCTEPTVLRGSCDHSSAPHLEASPTTATCTMYNFRYLSGTYELSATTARVQSPPRCPAKVNLDGAPL